MLKISTPRLALRYFEPRDAAFLLELLNTDGWKKYIGDRNIHTLEAAETYMQRFTEHYENHGFGFYLVERRADGVPLGMCGLVRRDTLEHVDIGFAFLPEYIGKGIAHEAAAATMQYAQNELQLDTIFAITVEYNEASIRLIRKIGLKFKEIIRMPDDEEELMLFST